MAFFRKAGSILRQTASKHINQDIAASKPSIFQVIRSMSSSKVFIGGLSYSTDDTGLREAFSKYGDVVEARVIQDRETGRSRGFGFVTYATAEAASAAIQALDSQELHGRRVRVNYANDRSRGYGGGGAGFGNSGGFGGYGAGGNSYESQGGYAAGGAGNYATGSNYPSGGFTAGGTGSYAGGGYSGGSNNTSGNYASNSQDPSDSSLSCDANASCSDGFESSEYDKDASSGNMAGTNAGYNRQEPVDTDFRDEDEEPSDYANRRA